MSSKKYTRRYAPCSVDGCEKAKHDLGLCGMHAWRLRTYGTTDDSPRARGRTLEQRFWRFVEKGLPEECWHWTGTTAREYGRMMVESGANSRYDNAHRVSWQLHFGPIPDGLWVLHTCDNPPCVNPNHLFIGTCADNIADRDRKGRQVTPLGENHWQSKLFSSDIMEIRRLKSRGFLLREISYLYGISISHVHRIVTGQSWRHI